MHTLDFAAQEIHCDLSLNMLKIGHDSTFPLFANPTNDESCNLVEKFARDNDILYRGFHYTKSMTAYLYPQADLDRLTILGQFMCLDSYVDDLYGDLPTSQGLSNREPALEVMDLLDAYKRVLMLGHTHPGDHHAAQVLLKFCQNLIPNSDPIWLVRTFKNIHYHLHYALNPVAYGWRADGSTSIQDYIAMREIISGMYATIDFIEYANAAFLPQDVIADPQIAKLRQGCARICCLTNDLFSYEKEVMVRGLPLNLVRVIELNLNLSMPKAAIQATHIINQEIAEFKEAAANCQFWDARTNAQVLTYIEGLKYQIAATWFWGTQTNRYRSPQSPFIELRMML